MGQEATSRDQEADIVLKNNDFSTEMKMLCLHNSLYSLRSPLFYGTFLVLFRLFIFIFTSCTDIIDLRTFVMLTSFIVVLIVMYLQNFILFYRISVYIPIKCNNNVILLLCFLLAIYFLANYSNVFLCIHVVIFIGQLFCNINKIRNSKYIPSLHHVKIQ